MILPCPSWPTVMLIGQPALTLVKICHRLCYLPWFNPHFLEVQEATDS